MNLTMQRRLLKLSGFTLVELMIVVAIIGIISAIAYPSYQDHVRKTRRAAATACLMELGQFMERYYTTNMKYADADLPTTQCANDLADFYAFAFTSGQPTNTTYAIKAVPSGGQTSDKCGTLSLDQAGVRDVSTDVDVAECW